MKKTEIVKKQKQDYEKSLFSIIKKVKESKHKAITTVNKLLIELYWHIGENIVKLQEKGKWGDGVVEKLSQDLRMKYPEQSGFSVQNLWYMKKFYLTYRNKTILQPVAGEIRWTNNVIILDHTRTIEEKEFYLMGRNLNVFCSGRIYATEYPTVRAMNRTATSCGLKAA